MLNSEVPNRPKKLISELVQTEDALFLTYRPRHGPEKATGCFLIFFLIIWTAGCVAMAFKVIEKPELFLILFALPFWSSWCFLTAMLANILFGAERLVVTTDGIGYEHKVVWTLSRRFLRRTEILGIDSAVVSTDSESGAKTYAVEIVASGRKQLFGKGLSYPECDWLARTMLESLKLSQVSPTSNQSVANPIEASDLNLPTERPSDSDWYLEDDGLTLRWHNAGRLRWSTILGLLFINLFWNGIVGVFVGQLVGWGPADQRQMGPKGAEWWCLLVFLIPFELVGLAMFAGLLASILEMFRRTVWTFRQGLVESRHRWLVFSVKKQFEVDSGCRLVARETVKKSNKLIKSEDQTPPADDRFELAILNTDDVAICSMTGLTIGEARWMKAEIESRRPGWFRD